ncbi:IS66-like element accessory protein TnpA [Paraburkholderia sp. MM5477-R1]|uniref:IS66-like element accessory protein TnpA n=1 Tax=Paraburkholderia sp. MM5477-R1 TaxID=2991062 RepID=UPI003D2282D6
MPMRGEPCASVALIARQNDINANLLFKGRRQYLQGAYGLPTVHANAAPIWQQETQTPLSPATVIDDVAKPLSVPPASTATTDGGVCEVEFDHARLRISGEVSASVLRLLIRELSHTPRDAR